MTTPEQMTHNPQCHPMKTTAPGFAWIEIEWEDNHQKPVLRNSGISVKLIGLLFLRGLSPSKIAAYYDLPLPAIREALAYIKDHADIIVTCPVTNAPPVRTDFQAQNFGGLRSKWRQWLQLKNSLV